MSIREKQSGPRRNMRLNSPRVNNVYLNGKNSFDNNYEIEKDVASVENPKGTDLSDDREVSLLTEQISGLRSEYLSIQSSFLTMTAISFGGYGVILYYAYKLDSEIPINYLFLALPFLFGISFINILKYTIKMLGIGAYITHLEKTINCKVKKNVFAWHSKLAYVNGYNYVGVAHIVCNIALYALIGRRFILTMGDIKGSEPFIYTCLFISAILMIGVILYSLVVCGTQYDAVKYWSEKVYKTPYDQEIHTPYSVKRLFYKNIKRDRDLPEKTKEESKEENTSDESQDC